MPLFSYYIKGGLALASLLAVGRLRNSLCWLFSSISRNFSCFKDSIHCIAILVIEIDHKDILPYCILECGYDSLECFCNLWLLLTHPCRILNLLFQYLQIVLLFGHLVLLLCNHHHGVAFAHRVYSLSYSMRD